MLERQLMGKQSDRTMQLDVSAEAAFAACIEIIEGLGFKITASDEHRGFIQAKVAISKMSWGETVTVETTPVSPRSCQVNVISKSTWFTLVDWGKNDENVDAIEWRLKRTFQ